MQRTMKMKLHAKVGNPRSSGLDMKILKHFQYFSVVVMATRVPTGIKESFFKELTIVHANLWFLTLSQTSPGFYVSAVEVF